MSYAFSLIICAIEIVLIAFYFRREKVFCAELSDSNEEQGLKYSSGKKYIYTLIVISVCMIGASISIAYNVSNLANSAKLIILMGIVAAAAVIDLNKTIIPNVLILIGLAARVVIYAVEFFVYNDLFISQLKSDLIGFGIGFGILFIACVVTHGAVGFGDVKLFGIIGLLSGAICTYTTLIICLIVSTVASIVLLIAKKKKRKDSIPFGPCIAIGYYVAILLTCY